MSEIQRHVWVNGKVQGVGFRASLHAEATALSGAKGSVRGFVRNLPDGRVEAIIAGPLESVLILVAWCRSGPPGAEVTRLEVREETLDAALQGFRVQR